jgi:hypothetical protein
MPSHGEPSPQATCKATTKAGNPCRKLAVEDGFCVFHGGKLDLAELGRQGGKARGRRQVKQTGDRRVELAWTALEELLESDTPATAKVRAASELLDRLEPLLGHTSKDAAIVAAKRQLADEYAEATARVREKLESMLARRAAGKRARAGAEPTAWWVAQLGEALSDLERVIVDRTGREPIVRYAEVDVTAVLRGLVERGLIVPRGEWQVFDERVEARARELTAEAERRAAEAEERLAEFTLGVT